MKLLMESWKKYLNEATEDVLSDLEGYDNNSFQDIFSSLGSSGDRVLLSYAQTDLDSINQILSKSAIFIEMEQKITEKGNRSIVNSIPVIYVRSFESSFNRATRKRFLRKKTVKKINLEKFINQYKIAADNITKIMADVETMDHNRAIGIVESFVGFFDKDFQPTGEPKIDLETIVGNLDIERVQREADELVKLFAKNKRELTGRSADWPENTSDAAFMLTRFPKDVVRMSDFPGLGSCHSLDSDYRHCVFADSTKDGAVIYSLSRSGFKQHYGLELNQTSLDKFEGKEIFKDTDRKGVEGVEPTGRVRLRKVLIQGIEFAVIEKAIYGSFPIGSRDKIFQTLMDIQQSKFNQLTQPVNLKTQAVSHGGSYADTPFDIMVKEALDFFKIKHSNSIEKHETNEEDFVVTSFVIYNSIKRGDENLEFKDANSLSTIKSTMSVQEGDEEEEYRYLRYSTFLTLDISSIADRIDIDKLETFFGKSYPNSPKNFPRFLEYFPKTIELKLYTQEGFVVEFINTDSKSQTYNLVDDFHLLKNKQVAKFELYKNSLEKIGRNPEILKEIFGDFLKPEALSEGRSRYRIRIKRKL